MFNPPRFIMGRLRLAFVLAAAGTVSSTSEAVDGPQG
jgi:hypothetical protein